MRRLTAAMATCLVVDVNEGCCRLVLLFWLATSGCEAKWLHRNIHGQRLAPCPNFWPKSDESLNWQVAIWQNDYSICLMGGECEINVTDREMSSFWPHFRPVKLQLCSDCATCLEHFRFSSRELASRLVAVSPNLASTSTRESVGAHPNRSRLRCEE